MEQLYFTKDKRKDKDKFKKDENKLKKLPFIFINRITFIQS
ncbi:hypothetical protein DAT606_0591 [Melissococcus plutonius]|uniref:Uncharacterized protein n=1 Tax=Melissococcus plutonius TaxID=33970 RepID=A0A2Z5Y2Z4_9ENTE|nr:hypothetical protein DAT561_1018 [Melissococcus plutonius]BBD15181.1 hypothetical protein DAT585_0836 [Melissococcus plutonius]BBD16621.1 hypothetical protein DAT606_0591 [Melissococcus plutonius]BBP07175.1 hypothetical protein DAT1033_0591 [Melissococcus plutonius]